MTAAIPIVWLLAMLATRFANPVIVIGTVAVTLAVISVWRHWDVLRPLLRVTPANALLAAVSAAAMLAVTYVGYPIVARWVPAIGIEAHTLYDRFLSHRALPLLLAGVIPVVIAEEIVWRGVFQDAFGRAGVLVAATTYAAVAAPAGSLLLVGVAFVCGLYWSVLRQMSNSLIPSLCAHLAWDIALIVVPLVAAVRG